MSGGQESYFISFYSVLVALVSGAGCLLFSRRARDRAARNPKGGSGREARFLPKISCWINSRALRISICIVVSCRPGEYRNMNLLGL